MKEIKVLLAAFPAFGLVIGAALAFGIDSAVTIVTSLQSVSGAINARTFDHVHFIVRNLDQATNSYEKLLSLSPNIKGGFRRDSPNLRIAMLAMRGARIEMLEPGIAGNNRLSRFLKNRGEGVGGLSIFVDDFDREIDRLRKQGVAVDVTTSSIIDPKYPLRLGWVEADQGHGAWIEIADIKTIPPYEKTWNSDGQPNTIGKLDHVHFIVRNLDEAMKTYEKLLGLKPIGKGGFTTKFAGGRIGMLPLRGARIEMIEPSIANTRMYKFLKERGEGIGGLSIFVEDFDREIETLRKKGIPVEVMTTPAIDPKYPLRLGWVEADQAHGAWLEIVDVKTVPPYEKDWDAALLQFR